MSDFDFITDDIIRITIDYHRVTKTIHTDENSECYILNYSEKLIIDRKSCSLELIQCFDKDIKVSHKYEDYYEIDNLLDEFDPDNFLMYVKDCPDDTIDTPDDTTDYKITIDYSYSPQRVSQGSFNSHELPEDFSYFAEAVTGFMGLYCKSQILNPEIYNKAKRRTSDYIFCSVVFENYDKEYYYLTDDETVKVGDLVIVPAGRDNHRAVAEVIDIEYYSKENAPFPIEKTKWIIGKHDDLESS